MLSPALLAAIVAASWVSPQGTEYLAKIERIEACSIAHPCSTETPELPIVSLSLPTGGWRSGNTKLQSLPVQKEVHKQIEKDDSHIAQLQYEDEILLSILMSAVTRNML